MSAFHSQHHQCSHRSRGLYKNPRGWQRLTATFLFNSGEKKPAQRDLGLWGQFLPTEGQRTVCTPGPRPLTRCVPPAYHLPPFPLVSILRLTDASRLASLFLKVSFPFYSIIFRAISLISFQYTSSPSLEVSHISDDNGLIRRRQEESVQPSGGLTRIRWGWGSSLLKHCLRSLPSCPSIRNEKDGGMWLSLFSQSGFLVSFELGEMLVAFHRKFILELCYGD